MQTPESYPPTASTPPAGFANSASSLLGLDEAERRVRAERIIQAAAKKSHAAAARAIEKLPSLLAEHVKAAMPNLVATPEQIAKYEADRAERQRLQNRAEFWARCNVPAKYRGVPREPVWDQIPESIDERPVREPYRVAFSRLMKIESIKGGAIIAMLGDRGPGKTWMSCCLVKRFCAAARSAMYSEALGYFEAIRNTFGPNGVGNELEVKARYQRQELLVLDAVEEKSETSAHQQQEITRLINWRLMADKLTLIISNDDGSSLADRIGPSLRDRLNDGGGSISCRWPSLRGKL